MRLSGKLKINVALLTFAIGLIAGSPRNVHADFVLGTPTNPGPPVNTPGSDGTPCISTDGLTLYFTSNRAGGSGGHDLWVTTRTAENEAWPPPINLGSRVNSSAMDYFPCISADGLSLCFYSTRAGGRGGGDLWIATRPSLDAPWTQAVNLGTLINSAHEDVSPHMSRDGLSLLFASDRPGGSGNYDLYVSTRTSTTAPWSVPANLGSGVNTPSLEAAPCLSCDGLTLLYHSIRSSGYGSYDLYIARRSSTRDAWTSTVNLGPIVNSGYSELGPSLSGNGRFLYFSDHYMNPPRPGGLGTDDIWQVPITPIVDFNRDERVDIGDILVLIEFWGQAEPLADIGPTPFGDGTVDARDLEVLMSHWGQHVLDPSIVAYWALDETEGTTAYDNIGGHDGTVTDNPLWQPDAGKVGGALELDGTYFVVADSVLNPADGPFSVFAWVKGGAPGQVITSQEGGANWLMADPATGALMSELKSGGRFSSELCSQTSITDGDWHHIGLTWDGTIRSLRVDDILVAEDTQSGLAACSGGFNIGCGAKMAPDSFWSGLIDDIRVYRRVTTP